jgi:hypothetical protein
MLSSYKVLKANLSAHDKFKPSVRGRSRPGPRPGAQRRCSGLTMHYSRTIEDTVAIITEGGLRRSEFLDPPLRLVYSVDRSKLPP